MPEMVMVARSTVRVVGTPLAVPRRGHPSSPVAVRSGGGIPAPLSNNTTKERSADFYPRLDMLPRFNLTSRLRMLAENAMEIVI